MKNLKIYRAMKLKYRFSNMVMLLAAGLMVLAVGCEQNNIVPNDLTDRVETLSLNIEGGTKVSVANSNGAVTWVSGDEIAVLTTSTTKNCAVNASTNNVQIPLSAGESRTGYAVYPASWKQTLTTSAVAVTYPTSYGFPNGFDSEVVTLPMVAVNSSSSNTLAFKQIGGILRITASLPAGTKYITVTTTGSAMCGVASVSNLGSDNATASIASGTNAATFEVAADNGLASATNVTMNLPVPCGTYNSLEVVGRNSSMTEVKSYSINTPTVIGHADGKKIGFSSSALASVAVSGTNTVTVGSTITLTATARDYANNTLSSGVTYAWHSSDDTKATVSASGVVTGVAAGSANITVTATKDGITVASAAFAVTVGSAVVDHPFSVSASKKVLIAHGNLKMVKSGSTTTYSIQSPEYNRCFPSNSATWNENNRDLFTWSEACNTSSLTIDGETGYRILTKDEWVYLINTRTGKRYAKATVAGVAGLIIFPDEYTHPSGLAAIKSVNTGNAAYTANSFTADQWSAMSNAGAVFLPAAGRYYSSVLSYVGSLGSYWSSTRSNSGYAYRLYFLSDSVNPSDLNGKDFYFSVRPVREYNNN
jgi:hypothetical protein